MHSLRIVLNSLADYPSWFVLLCLCLSLGALFYVAVKLLKWAFYLLLALLLAGGICWCVWLLFSTKGP
jgi:lipoprotein signal peptidase